MLPSSTSTSAASRYSNPIPTPSPTLVSGFKDVKSYEYTSMKNLNESKHGFWGALARKSKAILDDDNEPQRFDSPGNGRTNVQMPTTAIRSKYRGLYLSNEIRQKIDNPNCRRD